jgi:pimeloyl-ACP methyl ester carboxylesterase
MFNTYDYFFRPTNQSLADYLVGQGYSVLAFHLSGYGKSPRADRPSFDAYVDDYVEVFTKLRERREPKFYLGHSVGALAGLTAAARLGTAIDRAVLVAPAVWTFTEPMAGRQRFAQRAKLETAYVLARAFGELPSKQLGLGTTPAPVGYLRQFRGWVRGRRVASVDGAVDYSSLWSSLKIPILVLSGPRDQSMAPPPNVAWVMAQLKSAKHEEVRRASTYGFDADHFGLIYGKNAATHVWPRVGHFFDEGRAS